MAAETARERTAKSRTVSSDTAQVSWTDCMQETGLKPFTWKGWRESWCRWQLCWLNWSCVMILFVLLWQWTVCGWRGVGGESVARSVGEESSSVVVTSWLRSTGVLLVRDLPQSHETATPTHVPVSHTPTPSHPHTFTSSHLHTSLNYTPISHSHLHTCTQSTEAGQTGLTGPHAVSLVPLASNPGGVPVTTPVPSSGVWTATEKRARRENALNVTAPSTVSGWPILIGRLVASHVTTGLAREYETLSRLSTVGMSVRGTKRKLCSATPRPAQVTPSGLGECRGACHQCPLIICAAALISGCIVLGNANTAGYLYSRSPMHSQLLVWIIKAAVWSTLV